MPYLVSVEIPLRTRGQHPAAVLHRPEHDYAHPHVLRPLLYRLYLFRCHAFTSSSFFSDNTLNPSETYRPTLKPLCNPTPKSDVLNKPGPSYTASWVCTIRERSFSSSIPETSDLTALSCFDIVLFFLFDGTKVSLLSRTGCKELYISKRSLRICKEERKRTRETKKETEKGLSSSLSHTLSLYLSKEIKKEDKRKREREKKQKGISLRLFKSLVLRNILLLSPIS